MPLEHVLVEDPVLEFSLIRLADTEEKRTLIDALPNDDPVLDPQQYINDETVIPQNC